jgi:hypothetical protein
MRRRNVRGPWRPRRVVPGPRDARRPRRARRDRRHRRRLRTLRSDARRRHRLPLPARPGTPRGALVKRHVTAGERRASHRANPSCQAPWTPYWSRPARACLRLLSAASLREVSSPRAECCFALGAPCGRARPGDSRDLTCTKHDGRAGRRRRLARDKPEALVDDRRRHPAAANRPPRPRSSSS